tara:strand:- start:992 stop:1540 length:549 start_codon:yes stop_codon:yes gene_type:complete
MHKVLFYISSLILHALVVGSIYASYLHNKKDLVVFNDVPVMLYTFEQSQEFIIEEHVVDIESEEPIKEVKEVPKEPESTNSVPIDSISKESNHTKSELIGELNIRYPKISNRRGEEGVVVISAYISEDGHCIDTKLVKSSGHKRLDNEAQIAFSKMSYSLSTEDGKAVSSWNEFEVVFKLVD